MFCLEKKCKTNKCGLMFCEYTWKPCANILAILSKKSLNLTEDGFNCILHWLCHCSWSVTAFFNSLHNFTKKTIFFHCLFLPSSNPAPFSLHSSKVFIYLSYFHSTVINSCSAVQAGSGFYSLGIQAHHEKCCWYWYEGVLCINPPS